MSITTKTHYNPCFWTALWNKDYYENFVNKKPSEEKLRARKQVVNSLNIRSKKLYPTTTENVHFQKSLGLAEISRTEFDSWVKKAHPNEYDNFKIHSKHSDYPLLLDFENIFSGLESTPAYLTMLDVVRNRNISNIQEKTFLSAFIVLQHLRSHSILNSIFEWNQELKITKFEYLINLKWNLSDQYFLFEKIQPFINSTWIFHTANENIFPLCDSPVLINPINTLIALSPRLLLEIQHQNPEYSDLMPIALKITAEKLEEFRKRSIGNTFSEIIGELKQLEEWKSSKEFEMRYEIIKNKRSYNKIIKKTGLDEIWHINTFANQSFN